MTELNIVIKDSNAVRVQAALDSVQTCRMDRTLTAEDVIKEVARVSSEVGYVGTRVGLTGTTIHIKGGVSHWSNHSVQTTYALVEATKTGWNLISVGREITFQGQKAVIVNLSSTAIDRIAIMKNLGR